jgi:hypothetical protein
VSTYLVAGGIFQDLNSNELFSLVCSSPGELPYVLEEGKRSYFKLIWKNAHLYQVEEDYTLTPGGFITSSTELGGVGS